MEFNWIELLKTFVFLYGMLVFVDVINFIFKKDRQRSLIQELLNFKKIIINAIASFIGSIVYILLSSIK
jgi:hypothetical protein